MASHIFEGLTVRNKFVSFDTNLTSVEEEDNEDEDIVVFCSSCIPYLSCLFVEWL